MMCVGRNGFMFPKLFSGKISSTLKYIDNSPPVTPAQPLVNCKISNQE